MAVHYVAVQHPEVVAVQEVIVVMAVGEDSIAIMELFREMEALAPVALLAQDVIVDKIHPVCVGAVVAAV
jgi:hypothetical protein